MKSLKRLKFVYTSILSLLFVAGINFNAVGQVTAPSNVSATADSPISGDVEISWEWTPTTPGDEIYVNFTVYRTSLPGTSDPVMDTQVYGTPTDNAGSYSIVDEQPGMGPWYYYVVAELNGVSSSPSSQSMDVYPSTGGGGSTTAPSNVSATADSPISGDVEISWEWTPTTPGDEIYVNFTVYRTSLPGTSDPVMDTQVYGTPTDNAGSYSIVDEQPGMGPWYYYVVAELNGVSSSPSSQSMDVYPSTGGGGSTTAPSNVSATADSPISGDVEISWEWTPTTPGDEIYVNFTVYRTSLPGTSDPVMDTQVYGTPTDNAGSYSIVDEQPGMGPWYYYVVAELNGVSSSPSSQSMDVYPSTGGGGSTTAPSNVSATADSPISGDVEISWEWTPTTPGDEIYVNFTVYRTSLPGTSDPVMDTQVYGTPTDNAGSYSIVDEQPGMGPWYYYVVAELNGVSSSPSSQSMDVYPSTGGGGSTTAPSNVSATADSPISGDVEISWEWTPTTPGDEIYVNFTVYRTSLPGTSDPVMDTQVYGTPTDNAGSYSIVDEQPGMGPWYYYVVAELNGVSSSPSSQSMDVYPSTGGGGSTTAPSNVSATADSPISGDVEISWEWTPTTPGDEIYVNFTVYRTSLPGTSDPVMDTQVYGTPTDNAGSYSIVDEQPGMGPWYYYVVAELNGVSSSPSSQSMDVYPSTGGGGSTTAPSNVSATADSPISGDVEISWEWTPTTPGDEIYVNFTVYRTSLPGTSDPVMDTQVYGTPTDNAGSYSIVDEQPGMGPWYYYVVAELNGVSSSPSSQSMDVYPTQESITLDNISYDSDAQEISISWTYSGSAANEVVLYYSNDTYGTYTELDMTPIDVTDGSATISFQYAGSFYFQLAAYNSSSPDEKIYSEKNYSTQLYIQDPLNLLVSSGINNYGLISQAYISWSIDYYGSTYQLLRTDENDITETIDLPDDESNYLDDLPNYGTYTYQIRKTDTGNNVSESFLTLYTYAAPVVYTVNSSGGADYYDISSALNEATDLDTIEVQPGTYSINTLWVYKYITIRSAYHSSQEWGDVEGTVLEGTITFSPNNQSDNYTLSIDGLTIDGTTNALTSTSGNVEISNSIIKGASGGSAIQVGNEGSSSLMDLDINSTRFINNQTTSDGAAINAIGPVNLTVTNSEFIGNRSLSDGGAISLSTGSKLTINQSSFLNNEATESGGAISAGNGDVTLNNSIVHGNTSGSGTQIATTGTVYAINSIIEDLSSMSGVTNASSSDSDPLLTVSESDYSVTVEGSSPIFGASNSSLVSDLYGNERPNPAGSAADIGPYEYSLGEALRVESISVQNEEATRVVSATPTFVINGSTLNRDGLQVQVSSTSDFAEESILWDSGELSSTSETFAATYDNTDNELLDGTTYYVRAKLLFESFSSEWASSEFTMNTVPTAPVASNEINEYVTEIPYTLTLGDVNDSDGDVISYSFELATDEDFTEGVQAYESTSPSWKLSDEISDDVKYYWRATVSDGYETSEVSEVSTFETNLENSAPNEFTGTVTANSLDDITLSWSGGEDADPYDAVVVSLEVSDAEDFSSEVFGLADASSGASIEDLSENGVYYWRLTATDASGATSSTSARFIVDLTEEAPSVVSLSAPAADAVVRSTDVTLSWDESVDADPDDVVSYRVEVSSSDDFTTLEVDESGVSGTSFQVSLDDNSVYYWRVSASDDATDQVSEVSSFTVNLANEAPGVFTANTPVVSVNTETGEIEIDFAWSAATDVDPGDAVSYRLEFGEDADNVTSYDAGTELAFMLSSTDNFEDNSVYYWRIVAIDSDGLTTENSGGFARVSINTVEEGPTDFTLLAPEAQQVVSSLEPTLRWTAPTDPDDGSLQALGAGAGGLRVIDGYRVYWSTSESALSDEALDSETSTLTPDIVTTTSYTFAEGALSDNTVYYWRVEAFDDTDRSTRSGIGEFATNLANESPSELSVEPISLGINADDASVIDASLSWSGGEDADPYDAVVVSLEVSDAEDFSSEVFGLADASSGASIEGLSENGVYYWRLTATDASGATSSTSARFIVDLTEEAPSVVSLSAPAADAVVRSTDVTLSWGESVDADPDDVVSYRVEVSSSDDFTTLEVDESGVSGTSFQVSLDDNSVYYWRVSASDDATDQVSEVSSFTVNLANEAPGVFTANTPVVSVNTETGEIEIDFAWSAATDVDPGDAVSYRLEFGEDADNVTSYDAGTELAFMLSSTDNFEDNSVYYWRIVAIDSDGLTTENSGGFARVSINTVEEGPTDFTLLAPEAQQVVSSLEPTLRWTAPTDPDDGSLQALGAGAGGLRVIDGYRVYWSTSESALSDEALDSETSTLTPDIVTTTSYTFAEGALSDNTVYYWRVEAFDDTDRSTRSGIGEFATNLANESPSELSVEPISLGINADDASVIDASLSWSGGEDADPYDAVVVSLEVSDAEDFSSEVFGLADASSGASIEGLSENGVYYWRLTATDASGATSSTSARFIVDLTEEAPSVVSLSAPAADAVVRSTDVTLSWGESVDADPDDVVSYRVEVSSSDDFTTLEVDESGVSGTSFQVSLDDNSVYYWRVSASDDATDQVSEVSSFTVNLANEAPGVFALVSPLQLVLSDLSPEFSWSGSTDPDVGDAVSYRLEVGTSPVDYQSYEAGSATSWSLEADLEDNTRYYWRVVASDTEGMERGTSWSVFTTDVSNDEPMGLALVNPVMDVTLSDNDIVLTWAVAEDADDAVVYYVPIVDSGSGFEALDTLETNYYTLSSVAEGSYSWAVLAYDGFGAGDNKVSSDTTSFYVDATNQSPDVFAAVSPLEGDTVESSTVRLMWDAAVDQDLDDAVSYQVWFGEDVQNWQSYAPVSGQTELEVPVSDNTGYIWQVVATDSWGARRVIAGEYMSFYVNTGNDAPSVPRLITPESMTVVATQTPSFEWTGSSDAEGDALTYLFALGSSEDLSGVMPVKLSEPRYSLTEALSDNAMYYWSVGVTDGVDTVYTETSSFTVNLANEAPGVFALVSPLQLVLSDLSPEFSWSGSTDPDVGDAVSYRLEVGTSPVDYQSYEAGSATSWSLEADLEDNTRYYWRVVASDTEGMERGTSWSVFTTDVSNDEPMGLALVNPVMDVTLSDNDIVLTWAVAEDADDAVVYYVPIVDSGSGFEALDTLETNYYTLSSVAEGSYSWAVLAYDGFGAGDNKVSSDTTSFYVDATNQSPDVFAAVSPLEGDTVESSTVRLMWDAAVDQDLDDAVSYQVWFGEDVQNWQSYAPVSGQTELEVPVSDNTGYIWQVVATDSWGARRVIAGEYMSFYVNTGNDAPSVPRLITPESMTVVATQTPSFEWTGSSDAEGDALTYLFALGSSEDLSGVMPVKLSEPRYSLTEALSDNAMYYWSVGVTDGVDTVYTETSSFTVNLANEAPGVFAGIAPLQPEINSITPEFKWTQAMDNDPADVVHYALEYGYSVTQLTKVETLTDTTFTLDTPLEDNSVVYWRVVAKDKAGATNATDWYHFKTNTENDEPAGLQLVSPSADVTLSDSTLMLVWSPAMDADMDAIEYVVMVDGGEGYAAIDTVSSNYITLTHLNEANYSWYVSSMDGQGAMVNSDTLSFTIDAVNSSPEPFMALSPALGDTVATDSVTFMWTSSMDKDPNDDLIYVIAYGSDVTNATYVTLGTDTTYTVTGLLDNKTYYWSVVASDNNGATRTIMGDYLSFTVNSANDAPTVPRLITPTMASVEVTQNPFFEWTESMDGDSDALSYVVHVATDSLMENAMMVETMMHQLAWQDTLEDNQAYYWQVMVTDKIDTVYSERGMFTVNTALDAPTPFNLLTPVNGDSGIIDMPTLTWEDSFDYDPGDFVQYRLAISRDSLFQDLVFSDSLLTENSYRLENPLTNNAQYYWMVEAIDTDSLVTKSPVQSFIVGLLSVSSETEMGIPTKVELAQNYPNPFNPSTQIQFALPEAAPVRLEVYNALGQKVATLVDEMRSAGYHTIQFDASQLSSGVYLYVISTPGYMETRKMMLIK